MPNHLKVNVENVNINQFPDDKSGNIYDFNFLILEHFLDQSIKLRLIGETNLESLKEAHDSSTIISKIFGILNLKYKGNIPFNLPIEARKSIAKFIGLSSFKLGKTCLMKLGPNCAINGPCCAEHRVEGLKDAHEMFPKFLESIGINLEEISDEAYQTSLLALYADLKNQIIVSELELQLESTSKLDNENMENISHYLENLLETFFGPSMHINYLKSKLQSRAVQIRALLEQQHSKQDLIAKLKEKFPRELFEMNMKNVLQSVYSKLSETQLNYLVKKGNNVIEKELISNYESKSGSDAEIAIEMDVDSDEIREEMASVNLEEKDIGVNMEQVISPLIESKDILTTKNNAYSGINIVPCARNNTTESSSSSPFKGVVISGRFFRGILEPVDERFATIIEGRDVNVKQYLLQRKRKAAVLTNTSGNVNGKGSDKKLESKIGSKAKGNSLLNSHSKSSKSNTNNHSNVTKSHSSINRGSTLMERHNSAERISWETQLMESETINNENDNTNIDVESDNARDASESKYSNITNKAAASKSKSNSDKNNNNKGRRRFSEKEVLNLIEGIRRFGRDWCRILKNYEFEDRSNVDLKDKARNLEKLGLI